MYGMSGAPAILVVLKTVAASEGMPDKTMVRILANGYKTEATDIEIAQAARAENAVPLLLGLGPKDNGKSTEVPECWG
jgi:hypothetical protein